MATIRRRPSGNWEVIIRRKALFPRQHTRTFDSEDQAKRYAKKVEALLDQGIVPTDLAEAASPTRINLQILANQYLGVRQVSELDKEKLRALSDTLAIWEIKNIDHEWAQQWITAMKREQHLAPGSIKKYVGAVARLLDWLLKKGDIAINPLRHLETNYAAYTDADSEIAGFTREDTERDRRLAPDEEERIRKVLTLDGDYLQTLDRQRLISEIDIEEWRLLFDLSLETAMRLREMYTLDVSQIQLDQRTIFLDKTKNGDKRQVPLSSVAMRVISQFLENHKGDGLLFPWWSGKITKDELKRTTSKLSRKWSTIAKLAQCRDLHFHDLRHEATSRFYERTTLSDLEIAKITGHKDLRMLKRYANLRGSTLASKLW